MASIYPRGKALWAHYYEPDGTRRSVSLGLRVGQEAAAQRLADLLEQKSAEEAPAPSPKTVAEWVKVWGATRDKRPGWKPTESRLRMHVLPEIGAMLLGDVKPRHLIALVQKCESAGLAPRTVRMVYSSCRLLFRAAQVAELIPATPCVLREQLPKNVDRDATWRALAVFNRGELEQLLDDERLPPDERILVALKGLAGLRNVEASALRWSWWDRLAAPLTKLLLARTKTGQPRQVPVHPVLAAMLSEWALSGWAARYGRSPQPEDLMVPRSIDPERERTALYSCDHFKRLLVKVGLRHRRGHDLRRTFVTLTRADGARSDVLEAITHGTRGNIVDVYTEWPWATLCEAVSCLKVARRERRTVTLLRAATGTPAGTVEAVAGPTLSENAYLSERESSEQMFFCITRRDDVSSGLAPPDVVRSRGDRDLGDRQATSGVLEKRLFCTNCGGALRGVLELIEGGRIEEARERIRGGLGGR